MMERLKDYKGIRVIYSKRNPKYNLDIIATGDYVRGEPVIIVWPKYRNLLTEEILEHALSHIEQGKLTREEKASWSKEVDAERRTSVREGRSGHLSGDQVAMLLMKFRKQTKAPIPFPVLAYFVFTHNSGYGITKGEVTLGLGSIIKHTGGITEYGRKDTQEMLAKIVNDKKMMKKINTYTAISTALYASEEIRAMRAKIKKASSGTS
jgi:hypothetical protein